MRGVNKVILVGTLGRDPETKTFPNGGSLTQFSIATAESWTDKSTGERKEQTEWHRIVLNNRLGEIAQQYLRKGSKVYIEGSLRTRQWTDQNGQERYTTEIRGDQMQMLDTRSQGEQPMGGGQDYNHHALTTMHRNKTPATTTKAVVITIKTTSVPIKVAVMATMLRAIKVVMHLKRHSNLLRRDLDDDLPF